MKLSLLDKGFPHWSETLSVLTYADESIPFVSHKWLKEEECYVDPLGKRHTNTITSKYAADEGRALVVNGSIHLETHPLSKNKIPYTKQPFKLAIEHTTGYSPWDFLQMVDLANISANNEEDAQGSKVIYLMSEKCFLRFMTTNWNSVNKHYYEVYKNKISDLIERGYIIPTKIEPSQFWLEEVPKNSDLIESDRICICLNWCNLKKAAYVDQIASICNDLHAVSNKGIDIRLHSYTRKSYLERLERLDYVNLIPYESMSKYDIMDKYYTYFVDGTGLGYEIAYRNKFFNRNVNIFYLSGLPSDNDYGGFDGIYHMGATPICDQNAFIKGCRQSNFSDQVIKESFPHQSGKVPEECLKILQDASEKFLKL